MATTVTESETHHVDIEQGIVPQSSLVSDEGSRRSTDAGESSSGESCTAADIVGSPAAVSDKERRKPLDSNASQCCVDLGSNEPKLSLHSAKVKRNCRICHLSFDGSNPEIGFTIELGCSCKDDLAAAHKHCAEAWFKIRGNKTCEICGSTARNVVGVNEVELLEEWNEANENAATAAPPPQAVEIRRFWQGHRFLNFLLACMVFAFVISWLFHFNVPS